MAYYASYIKDEARETRVRLHCFLPGLLPGQSLSFPDGIKLESPDTIAKLSHVVHQDYCLEVIEHDGTLLLKGISSYFGPLRQFNHEERFPESLGQTVAINGPGDVAYYDYPRGWLFRHGVIQQRRPLQNNPDIRQWQTEAKNTLADELHLSGEQQDYCRNYYSLQTLVADLVRRIIDFGHGGMVAIVPEQADTMLKIGYHSDPQFLRTAIKKHWESLFETRCASETFRESLEKPIPQNDLIRLLSEEPTATAAINQAVKAIAQLANMDGCIVIRRNLSVVGFGGIIQAQEAAAASKLELHDRRGQKLDANTTLRLKGTRHRSAYQLCKSIPGSLVLVISQDGDVRVFASDNRCVTFDENLYP